MAEINVYNYLVDAFFYKDNITTSDEEVRILNDYYQDEVGERYQ